METWKRINGYESSHMVSNRGRIKSLCRKVKIKKKKSGKNYRTIKEKILKNNYTKSGYASIQFTHKGKRYSIHRLVAVAFIPNPLNKPCINHIDGDPSNNNIKNLEWCTYSENEKHSYRVLGKVGTKYNLKHYSKEWESPLVVGGLKLRGKWPKTIYRKLIKKPMIKNELLKLGATNSSICHIISRLGQAGIRIIKKHYGNNVYSWYIPK